MKNIFYQKRDICLFILFLTVPFCLFSQEEQVNQDVQVIREYNPTVSDAFKINDMPTVGDTLTSMPIFRYQLKGKALETSPNLVPFTAARIAQEPLNELFPAYIMGYGGFFAPKSGGIYGGNLVYNLVRNENFALAFNAQHESAVGKIELENGENETADYHDTKAGLYLRHFFKKSTLSANMDFYNYAYKYYGYNTIFDTAKYINNTIDGTDILSDKQQQTAFDLNARLNNRVLKNDTKYDVLLGFYTFGNLTGVTENSFRYGGDFDFSIADFIIRIGTAVDFAGTKTSKADTNPAYNFEDRNRTLLEINPALLLNHGDFIIKLGMKFGIDFDDLYELDPDPAYKKEPYISPDVSVNFLVENRVALFAGITGDINPNSYRSIMAENPYISPDLNVRTAFYQIKFFAGLKGNFSNKTAFAARVEYGNFRNEHFFVNKFFVNNTLETHYSNQFGVEYDDGRLLSVSGEFKTFITDYFDITLHAAYFGYNLDSLEKAWHKPNMELGLRANFKVTQDLIFTAAFNILGERFALIPDDATTQRDIQPLKPVFDFNLGAKYNLTHRWSLFASAQNIFLSKYYLYNGYPMHGINARIGAGYSF
ncbi:MAG: TonB-dependent receptor [Marinilabiliaceae bacterium]|nr:TonB-dependent receptor [Marinilabiliaceae bacterium]